MKQIVKILLIIVLCIISFDASAQYTTIRRGNRTQQTQQQQQQQTQRQQQRQNTQSTQSTEEQKYNKDLKEGESLVEAEKYSEAKRHFTIMYAKYPNHEKEIERWLEVCEMFMVEQEEENKKREEEERRQQELERLHEIETAYQNDMELGEQYISERQYEKALSHFQAMLSEYSEFPDYCNKINEKISYCEEMKFADKTITVNGVSFKMIAVKGGTFTMGATSEQGSDVYDDEEPTHMVTLSDYYIGETEVTQALWEAVMGSNPSYWKGSNLPVECVSWEDCQEFISRLNSLTGENFSLPTEAEWEYAARGGNKSQGYKYSGSNVIDRVAWYDGNSGEKTHPVKQKQANELGIYDMTGNVEEWCSDWFGSYSSSSQTNPSGPSTGTRRVIRDGSWYDYASYCRVSYRASNYSSLQYVRLGLRLAMSSL